MSIRSDMTLKMTIKIKHDGEATDISQAEVVSQIKISLAEHFSEDQDLQIEQSVYVAEFSYSDNADSLRARAHELIDQYDPDDLAEAIQKLKEQS